MPIQAPQWTDYLNCPVCCREFGVPPRSPISLSCGHTLCRHCLKNLHRKQCPFDQTLIEVEPEELVVNTALLQLAGHSPPTQPYHPPSIQALPDNDKQAYDCIVKCMEHLAVYLKYCGNVNNTIAGSRLSRPMQRKLVMLLQCAITDEEGRGRAARAARSLGERTVTELILQHQNPQQLSANLWAAVRARGCQFLGPAMQEEVLKLVLLALEDGSALSRKVLVMFVVQRLEPHFPQASKTSIGHVVQLLYRASCFKVSKRECDSSLMQLKEEFRTYETLRREHDAQIVQIATEAGLRIAPDQWSALLYGDTAHKSHMQSIIDKLQTPQSFAQSVQELFIALQRTGDPAHLNIMSLHLDRLANIDPSPDASCPSWQQLAEVITSLKEVVAGLIHYLQQQALGRDSNHNQKLNITENYSLDNATNQLSPQTGTSPNHGKYKVAMCRDAASRHFCPRGNACTNAHSEEELESWEYYQVNGDVDIRFYTTTNGQGITMPAQYPSYVVPHPSPENYNSQQMALQPVHQNEIRENLVSRNHPPPGFSHLLIGPTNNILIAGGAANANCYYRVMNHPSVHHSGTPQYSPLIPPPGYIPPANGAIPVVHPGLEIEDFNPTVPPPPYRRNCPPTYNLLTGSATDTVWAPGPQETSYLNRSTIMSQSLRSSPVNGASSAVVGGPIMPPNNTANGFNGSHNRGAVNGAQRPAAVLNRLPFATIPLERPIAPEQLEPTASYEDTGLDDEELEAGLQALELRIDTEFKNSD